MSLPRQFLLIGAILLLASMIVVGSWLGMEIERSAVNRAAAVSAVYVESILAAELQRGSDKKVATAAMHSAFDRIFVDGPLHRKVVRFKLWDAAGTIIYSSDHTQLGTRFPVTGLLAAAFGGEVQSRLSDLQSDDNQAERAQWRRLIEVYVPVRMDLRGEVLAVAEFYHSTENIDREIRSAQWRSWALVIVATLAILLLLFGMVRRVDNTLLRQRDDLQRQLQQLGEAFAENERMRTRLGEAGAATTALNERLLRRIAADLHDGPAQTLAYVLMRFDEMVGACGCCNATDQKVPPDLPAIRGALRASLEELRNIAAGLGMPGIADLSLAETAQRAVRDFERRTGSRVDAAIDETLGAADVATKITVYRLLQESLSNSYRHAPGSAPWVQVQHDGARVRIKIADNGAGFDPEAVAHSGRLGLVFMQERVHLLGGEFDVLSAPGSGTCIAASLPLFCEESP